MFLLPRFCQALMHLCRRKYKNLRTFKSAHFVGIHFSKGFNFIAKSYIEKARDAYEAWGADVKVKEISDKYSNVISRISIKEKKEITDIDSKKIGELFTDEEIKKIFETTKSIVSDVISGNHDPVIVRNEKTEVLPLKLGKLEGEITNVKSFIEGLDTNLTENIVEKRMDK